jgi:hypothetical protein
VLLLLLTSGGKGDRTAPVVWPGQLPNTTDCEDHPQMKSASLRPMLRPACCALLVAASLAPAFVGCAKRGADAELLVRLERTPCFGTCPAYVVEVDLDGTVRYEGRRHVVTLGAAVGKVGPEGLQSLREAFRLARFRELPRHCCDCFDVTDQPGATTTLVDGRWPKTIVDYRGCRKAPDSLRSLEDEIDRIVGVERWIGTLDERRKMSPEWGR